MPKKFQTYQCTVCKRTIDFEFDPKYSKSSKCTITMGCSGNLNKIAEKNIGNLQPSFKPGLENWRPRNSKFFENTEVSKEEYINISSSDRFSFTLAVDQNLLLIDPFLPAETSNLFDRLELTVFQLLNKTSIYREYLFRITEQQDAPFLLDGLDANNKDFYFNDDEQVMVFLNGSPLVHGENNDYVLNGDDPTIEKNTIKFLISIPSYSTINVNVKKQEEVIEKKLTFLSNQSLENTNPGSWSNVNSITSSIDKKDGSLENRTFILFTIENPTELGYDVRIQPKFSADDNAIKVSSTTGVQSRIFSLGGRDVFNKSNTESIIGLLSERHFTCRDRITSLYFKISDIFGYNGFMQYTKNVSDYEWSVSKRLVKECQHVMIINSYISIANQIQYDPMVYENTDKKYNELNNFFSNKIINI